MGHVRTYVHTGRSLYTLGLFHTARVMPASTLILKAYLRKGILFTRRGPSQLIAIVSNGAFHTARARVLARARAKCSAGAPLVGEAPARACKKMLWDIAFNAHLHPHRVKRIPLRECALSVSADAGIPRPV